MKENSKKKLERQLNENPELKERFNLQMKSITNNVRALTEPLKEFADSVKALENLSSPLENIMNSFKAITPITSTQSIVESLELFNLRLKPLLDSITSDEHKEMVLLMDKTKIEYTSLRKSEREFIEHERLYIPNDVYEFLDWYLYCYLFDKHFDTRKEEELTLYHFNLFYKFKQRYKTHKKWGVEDERKFIKELESSDSDNKENVSDKPDWNFTALQWSIIFYYVEPDLYGNIEQKKNRLQAFITDFKVNKTLNSLSNKHSEIVRVVTDDEKNELKQIHISAIKEVLPFLEDNYPDAFIDADQDFKRLADNLDRK